MVFPFGDESMVGNWTSYVGHRTLDDESMVFPFGDESMLGNLTDDPPSSAAMFNVILGRSIGWQAIMLFFLLIVVIILFAGGVERAKDMVKNILGQSDNSQKTDEANKKEAAKKALILARFALPRWGFMVYLPLRFLQNYFIPGWQNWVLLAIVVIVFVTNFRNEDDERWPRIGDYLLTALGVSTAAVIVRLLLSFGIMLAGARNVSAWLLTTGCMAESLL